MSDQTRERDFLIVGGGLAGLTAAVRAAELGLRPVVLEQGAGDAYPCNSRFSGGILHVAYHDPKRPRAELDAIIRSATGGHANEKLAGVLSGSAGRLIDWLQSNGAKFMRFNTQEAYRWCLAPPRALRAGMDWQGRGPDVLLRQLVSKLETLGGSVRHSTRARALRMRDGVCIGVEAEHNGQTESWSAKHVLLADGGFQNNKALFEQHIGSGFDSVFQRGARTGVGAGMQMAQAVGAALTHTDRFYGHLLCRDSFSNDKVWPYPELDGIALAGIVVDGSGRRCADEGISGVYLTNTLALQASKSFYVIFDAAIWDGPGRSARIPANPLLEQAGGTVLRANSVAELARVAGLPVDALTSTIEEYNAALAAGSLGDLEIPRSTQARPWPISTGPYMAIPAVPGITYTMGGIAIDEHAQVLRTNGEVIPGLLAAGATTGGIEGGPKAAYISGLLKAGVFGLVAAERAAQLQQKRNGADAPSLHSISVAPPASAGDVGLRAYPVLRGIIRYGTAGATFATLAAIALVLLLGWSSLGVYALPLALLLGSIAAVVTFSYVELVKLITDLLIPK